MGRGDEITKVAESRGGGKSFTGLEQRASRGQAGESLSKDGEGRTQGRGTSQAEGGTLIKPCFQVKSAGPHQVCWEGSREALRLV